MPRIRTLSEVIRENLDKQRSLIAKSTTIADPSVLCKKSNLGDPIPRNVPSVGTGQTLVTSTPQQISYVNRNRLNTLLTMVTNGVDVFWGTNPSVSPFVSTTQLGNGSLLVGVKGAWVNIPDASVVFVVCPQGSTAVITWSEEYAD